MRNLNLYTMDQLKKYQREYEETLEILHSKPLDEMGHDEIDERNDDIILYNDLLSEVETDIFLKSLGEG